MYQHLRTIPNKLKNVFSLDDFKHKIIENFLKNIFLTTEIKK
jgi:hypothetical protein